MWRSAGIALALISAPVMAQLVTGGEVPTTPGQKVDGWIVDHAGIDRASQYHVTFRKGRAFKMVRIDPLGNVAQSYDGKAAVLALATTTALKGEVPVAGADCAKGDDEPIMAFFNPRTGNARGYFIVDEDIVVKRWKTRRAHCQNTGS